MAFVRYPLSDGDHVDLEGAPPAGAVLSGAVIGRTTLYGATGEGAVLPEHGAYRT